MKEKLPITMNGSSIKAFWKSVYVAVWSFLKFITSFVLNLNIIVYYYCCIVFTLMYMKVPLVSFGKEINQIKILCMKNHEHLGPGHTERQRWRW